ncbi:hypothetical protein BV898_19909 [Hypsibius exemplaris]|uniref:Major facilitator superfamily (MFS) profile domain-containing protein n=1 Tax=Hypsibius exemplaris TaxID=2072580 RepID=A0A9X6NK32_HYPEX|nr:hypothetical protein BV898_19909 [Hypsibius exemplaris]
MVGETWLNVTRDELNGVPGFITNNSAEVVDTFHPSLVLIENTSKEISARNDKAYVRWTLQFWLTGLLLVIGWFGYGAANTSLDVIALHIVDASPVRTSYGGNRVFGTVGFGVFALLAGQLMDTFSHTAEGRDFTPAFVTFFVASSGTVLLTFLLPKTHETSLSSDPEKKEEQVSPGGSPLSVFFTPDVILFWSGIFVVGICTGMLRSCIPWFLAELGANGLLVGMNFFIQCMYETPIMAVSGWIIRKLGFHTCMLLALLAFGVRFVALYFLLDPWYILLINLTHVFCFGLFYASMMGFAFEKAPPGTRGTLQGILSGTFSGVGQGIGGLTAGFIYQAYGGRTAWLSFGILALVTAFFYCIGMLALWRRERNVKVTVL